MLDLRLFRRRNFAIGNLETFSMYAGLAILFFFLIIFLQQVADYSPIAAGVATLPVDGRHVPASLAAWGDSPIATARACSWAPGR